MLNFKVSPTVDLSNEKSKATDSGGSTLARLKLKGIDGLAPQGVEYAA